MADISASELRALSKLRLKQARLLLDGGFFSGSYYLAGYCIEFGLKATIAEGFQAACIPDKKFVQDIYSHKIQDMVKLADLKKELDKARANDAFTRNCPIIFQWREQSREDVINQFEAQTLLYAVAEEKKGVLSWIKNHWTAD